MALVHFEADQQKSLVYLAHLLESIPFLILLLEQTRDHPRVTSHRLCSVSGKVRLLH
jgi:hypothetical protein